VRRLTLLFVLNVSAACLFAGRPPAVVALHCPNDGVYPQCALDADRTLHLIYFKGDPQHGDIFYVRSRDFGQTFTPAIRVNSKPQSALIIGAVRGPRLAIGARNRPHIAWMGGAKEFFYTRLDPKTNDFEPQRNIAQDHPGLDGGGTIAANSSGSVYLVWHASQFEKDSAESNRRVWVARSSDDGDNFSPPLAVDAAGRGVCGCCNLAAAISSDGCLQIAYRCATDKIHRDTRLLTLDKDLHCTSDRLLSAMQINKCIMSTTSFSTDGELCAFEGEHDIQLARISGSDLTSPESRENPKHPVIATNEQKQVLLAWTENTGWNKPGNLAWQLFTPDLKPIGEIHRAPHLAVWSIPTTFTRSDYSFVIFY